MTEPRTTSRLPALDGLRGVAILLVVSYHVSDTRIPGGWVGVDLFFALSGFLITGILVNELRRTGVIHFRAFFRRRALRLFPALVVFLAAVAIIDRHHPLMPDFVLATVTYVANIVLALGHKLEFTHTWSLAQEEQFYLLWPFVLLAIFRWRRGWTVIAALAVIALVWGVTAPGDFGRLYNGPDTHAAPILLGSLAGYLYAIDRLPSVRGAGMAALLGLAAVALFAHLDAFYPVLYIPVAVLAAVAVAGNTTSRALAWTPLRGLGAISYALYLWHPLVMHGTTGIMRPVAVVASIAIAVASYYIVERPFLRRRHPDPSSAPAIAPV